MKCGRVEGQEAEAARKDFQNCTDPSGTIVYLQALQGHSGRNPIDPSLQDDVVIPNNSLEYIYHIGCAFNCHSIKNSVLIPRGQKLSKERQTVFFTDVDLMNKEHKDPYDIDLEAPRLASYKHKKWRRHQDTVYWVDVQLTQQKGFKFYQTRSNATIFYDTLPAYCIPKVIMMESGEILFEKVYASTRLPPKISFKDNWMKELDSEVAGGNADSQQIQQKSKTQISRTGRLVSEPPPGLLTQEIEKDVLFGCERSNSRTERLVNAPSFSQSCVPVSVERVDKDKDADVNVDADQIRTVRLVSGQPTGLFTQQCLDCHMQL